MPPTRVNGPPTPTARPRRRAAAVRTWARLPDEQLLRMRFCDLKLSIERSPLARHVRRLYADLAATRHQSAPARVVVGGMVLPGWRTGVSHALSNLAHPPASERLERRLMHEAEGGNSRLLMRILRHEAGHALDNAYRLRRRRRWRDVFGPASRPYPARYRAGSRRYAQHLGEWYAQAHPTEDFAETFAVWLTPKSAWRRDYAGLAGAVQAAGGR